MQRPHNAVPMLDKKACTPGILRVLVSSLYALDRSSIAWQWARSRRARARSCRRRLRCCSLVGVL